MMNSWKMVDGIEFGFDGLFQCNLSANKGRIWRRSGLKRVKTRQENRLHPRIPAVKPPEMRNFRPECGPGKICRQAGKKT
jgi:hypothetical protein